VSDALAELLRHPALWRGAGAGAPEAIPTGFRALVAGLPGGGWPVNTLVELLVPAAGIGEVRLLLPVIGEKEPPLDHGDDDCDEHDPSATQRSIP